MGLAREQFHNLVRQALIELGRRRLARVTDQFGHTHFDDLFNPEHQRAMSSGELVDDYLSARRHAAKLDHISTCCERAARKRLISRNPATGLKLLVQEERKTATSRRQILIQPELELARVL